MHCKWQYVHAEVNVWSVCMLSFASIKDIIFIINFSDQMIQLQSYILKLFGLEFLPLILSGKRSFSLLNIFLQAICHNLKCDLFLGYVLYINNSIFCIYFTFFYSYCVSTLRSLLIVINVYCYIYFVTRTSQCVLLCSITNDM